MALILLLVLPGHGWSDNLDFTSGLGVSVPLEVVTANVGPFLWGETLAERVDYPLPFLPSVFLEATASFDRLHLAALAQYSVSTAGAGAGAGVSLGLGSGLRIAVAADAGYLVAVYNSAVSSSWFVQATSTLLLYVNPSFAVGAGAFYKMTSGLYEGAGILLSIAQRVPIEPTGD